MTSGVVVGKAYRPSMAEVEKGVFTIPASHVAAGGQAGRKQLLAQARLAELRRFQTAAPKKNPVGGDRIGYVTKGLLHQSVAPRLARRRPAAGTNGRRFVTGDQNSAKIIGKAFNPLGFLRTTKNTASQGFQAGQGLNPMSRIGTPTGVQGNVFRASQWAGKNPRKALAYGAGGTTAGGAILGASVNKRHGDPEDARYTRLGAGAALTAAGGVGALGYAGRDIARTTRLTRGGASFRANNVRNMKELTVVEGRGDKRVERKVKAIDPKLKAHARAFDAHGVALTRRGGAAGLGGLVLLGGAENLRRKATDRRWN